MKIFRRKSAKGKGFTLLETLLAMLIMVIFTAIMMRIIDTAVYAYKNVSDNTNADVLLSNTVTVLKAELSTAKDIEIDASAQKITYTDASSGIKCTISNSDNGLRLQRLGKDSALVTSSNKLVSKIDFSNISYSEADGLLIIGELKVVKTDNGTTKDYASIKNLCINNR